MLRSFVYVVLRKILKNTGGAYLNVACLALGIATCLFIFNFIHFELSYDQFSGSSTHYRVERVYEDEGNFFHDALTLPASHPDWTTFPMEEVVRFTPYSEEGTGLFTYEDPDATNRRIHLQKVYVIEGAVTSLFPIHLLVGEWPREHAPDMIFLSRAAASTMLRDSHQEIGSMVGRLLKTTHSSSFVKEYRIGGVFENLPTNTHLHFDALVVESPQEAQPTAKSYTYLAASAELPKTAKAAEDRFRLRPLPEIHLASHVSNNPEAGTSIALLIFLSIIGAIVMLLAMGNYVNGLLLNSFDRAKEIGIRKLLGIRPRQLMVSFLGEALIINSLATLLALVLFRVATNYSSTFGSGEKTFSAISAVDFDGIMHAYAIENVLFLTALTVLSSVLASVYPALYFNRLSPVLLLKNKLLLSSAHAFGGPSRLVKALIIFQVTASILFLSGVMIVHEQWKHLEQASKRPFQLRISGIFPGSSGANDRFSSEVYMRMANLREEGILRECSMSNLYNGQLKTVDKATIHGSADIATDTLRCTLFAVDREYLLGKGWDIAYGRLFDSHFGSDSRSLIINEPAMRYLGGVSNDSLIGQKLETDLGPLQLIGVLRDDGLDPAIYVSGFEYRTYFQLLLQYPGLVGESLESFLHRVQVRLSTPLPYFSLLKRDYESQKYVEESILNIFVFLSMLAICIAAFGMFGLSKFVAEKRAKEVGLRKILGASSVQAMWSLIWDFVKLMTIGAILAIPFVLWGGQTWLNDYHVRVTISPYMVALPIVVMSALSLLAILDKCWKAASVNPITIVRE